MANVVIHPKFAVVEMMEDGCRLHRFETPGEVAEFLWGKFLPYYAIFKNRELVRLRSSDMKKVERQLTYG